MAQPMLFDARQGLEADILDRMREAQRASLAAKNARTAVLGLWHGDELSVVLIEANPLFLTPIPPAPPVAPAGSVLVFARRTPKPTRGLVYDMPTAPEDDFWSRLLGLVRVGDVLRLEPDHDKVGLALLNVYAERTRIASLRIPRTPPAQGRPSVA